MARRSVVRWILAIFGRKGSKQRVIYNPGAAFLRKQKQRTKRKRSEQSRVSGAAQFGGRVGGGEGVWAGVFV